MSRMKAAFEAMQKSGEKILVSYFPIGDSIVEDTVLWADKFFDNGTTVLEMGLPYEDPRMDGPVVRASMERAIGRTNLTEVFASIAAIRQKRPEALLQVMTYVENVEKYGTAAFAKICADAGVDAVLAANASKEQMRALDKALGAYEIDNLRFVPFRFDEDTVEDLKAHASGYVYLQAVDGPTGSGGEASAQVGENIRRLRDAGLSVPLIPGFGISTAAHVKAYLGMGADGVIVGSAIIQRILAGSGEAYIAELRAAM